jgi:hypothetical protein
VSKILEIDGCIFCFWSGKRHEKCFKENKRIEDNKIISVWCPLPNKPEPITEQWLDDVQYFKIGKDLLVALINAHFLGSKNDKPILTPGQSVMVKIKECINDNPGDYDGKNT